MSNIFSSWQTTVSGVIAALVAWGDAVNALIDNRTETIPDWTLAITLTVVAIGLIRARDNNKTSEDVHAK